MNRIDFKTTNEITDFCKRCLENELDGKEIYRELWSKAKDLIEFKQLVKNDSRVKLRQGTAELLKDDWKYLRSILGKKQFKTDSDVGGVKIGNNDFSLIVPNGAGDGVTRVAILEPKENNQDAFNYFTMIDGSTNIYNYDCGNDVYCTLNGKYGVFYKDGFVIFEKWD